MAVWKKVNNLPGGGYKCSNCGFFDWTGFNGISHFITHCPKCHEKMTFNEDSDPLVASLRTYLDNHNKEKIHEK